MENKKRNILVLTPGFPADEADSNCIPFQQSLLLEWRSIYSSVNFIVLSFQYPYHTELYKWNGIKVIPFNGRNKGGLSRLLLREKIKKEIRKIDDQEAIDGAISFWYGECAWAGKWASKQLQIPHYCWIWGQDARKPNPYPPRLRLKGEELIALSDSLQHEFEKNHGIAPSHVIPPGIGKAHSWNETNRDIDLLAVGSLIPLKQYEIFVELVAELRNQFPTIKAVIIGEGPERKRLKEMIGRYQLENELQLKGELPNDEVIHFMRRSKLLLHPSSYEGFSIACLEALYANMEICSFVKPMNRSIENWYIVKDKKEMKLKTMELLQNRRNIQAGDPFPINVSIDRLMALFGF